MAHSPATTNHELAINGNFNPKASYQAFVVLGFSALAEAQNGAFYSPIPLYYYS